MLRAAEAGERSACLWVANSYLRGITVQQDKAEGFKWMLRAAETGDSDACAWIANAYMRGDGVEKDEETGLAWSLKAAEDGSKTDSSLKLAEELRQRGDLVGAYRLLYRAAKSATRAGEDERRSVLDALEKLGSAMTPAQRQEGRDLAMDPSA